MIQKILQQKLLKLKQHQTHVDNADSFKQSDFSEQKISQMIQI